MREAQGPHPGTAALGPAAPLTRIEEDGRMKGESGRRRRRGAEKGFAPNAIFGRLSRWGGRVQGAGLGVRWADSQNGTRHARRDEF